MVINASIQRILLFAISVSFFASCQKKDVVALSSATDITAYSIPGQNADVNVSKINHTVNLEFPISVTDPSSMTASFSLSSGASASIGGIAQVSGVTNNDFQTDINYQVTAADHQKTQQWTVRSTNNNYSLNWGMGRFLKTLRENDRNYEWYIDQGTSGTFASVNCGPTSVTMACKWADSNFSKTAVYARQQYESSGGWWFTYDVDSYLNDNTIPHAILALSPTADVTRQLWVNQLDSGNIIMLCIDMNYVSAATQPSYHVDKFYETFPGWGHFFVIKGYQQADDQFYFDIYDPNSFARYNDDGGLKGKDRFYRYQDVFAASSNWWKYCFIIAPKGKTIHTTSAHPAVLVSEITHAHGW